MKRTSRYIVVIPILFISLFTISAQENTNEKSDFPVLTGLYLGQKPQGMVPEIFAPGIISTAFHDVRIAFTPDLKECYFYTVYKPNDSVYKWTTLCCKYENGKWTYPEVVFFSGHYNDHAPCIHPDGSIFIYQSDKPVSDFDAKDEWNLWIMKKEAGKWSDPHPMGQTINGKGNVFGPSLAKNGNLYFTQELADGSQVIMRSEFRDYGYQEPQQLPEQINSVRSQFDAAIAPDESYIIVPVYGRDDAVGSTDYYISFRDENDNWTELKNLGKEINTENVESGPYISPDGKFFFFQSYGFEKDSVQINKPITFSDMHKMLKSSDIYWIDTKYFDRFIK